MGTTSFSVRQRGGVWIVEEVHTRQLGGIFATLIAALEFVDGEAHRFRATCTQIERSPGVDTPATRRASVSLPRHLH